MKTILASALLATLLGGCAVDAGVMPLGRGDVYTVTRESPGHVGTGPLKAEAMKEADRYCTRMQKTMQVVTVHETGTPFIPGNFPKAEVQFMCMPPR
ncbi:hypothetical protein BH09PSE5_BH09PSE5_16080 [soil metagenome]